MSELRRLITIRNRIIFIEAAEVIDPHHIIELITVGDPLHPPRIFRLAVIFPAVQRVTPQLSRSRERIRRTSGHRSRRQCIIQLEQLRIRPGICAVKSHINRNIPNNLYLFLIRIIFQCKPLFCEQILLKLIKFYFFRILFPVFLHGFRPA